MMIWRKTTKSLPLLVISLTLPLVRRGRKNDLLGEWECEYKLEYYRTTGAFMILIAVAILPWGSDTGGWLVCRKNIKVPTKILLRLMISVTKQMLSL